MAPMFKQCCCCCDLRTGVILIGIFTIVFSGYSIVNEVILLNSKIPAMEQYIDDHPSEMEEFASKYGISFDLLDNLGTIAKLGCAVSGVNVLAAVFLLIPACFSVPGQGSKVRRLIFIWVGWNIVEILWSLAYGGWIISKFSSPIAAASILGGLVISLPFTIYFLLVAVAYYQELGENGVPSTLDVPPSNVAYAHLECGDMSPPPYDYGKQYPDPCSKPV